MCFPNSTTVRILIWIKHFYNKFSLGHIILILSYVSFILLSAGLFYLTESRQSVKLQNAWSRQLVNERNSFVVKNILPQIFNNTKLFLYVHNQKSQHLTEILNNRLAEYERLMKLRPPIPKTQCTMWNSILFVFSSVTTIGYGYIYPVTEKGRMLSIAISIIGIPFTIILIKDLSYLLAIAMHLPCYALVKIWAAFRFCTLRPVDEYELEERLRGRRSLGQDYRLYDTERLLAIPVTVAIFSIIGWLTVGCFFIRSYFPTISYSTAFYFIFNSITTIGIDEIEYPENPAVFVLLLIYLLIGITLVSLFINLLHTKLSRAYWLPGKMYAPIRTHKAQMGSFDSLREITLDDYPFNHFTTLGVIHTDDKRELLAITRKERALTEAQTQTAKAQSSNHLPNIDSPAPVQLPYPTTSIEDVNELLIETYSKPLSR